MPINLFMRRPLTTGLYEIRASWGWFLALGIILIIAGAICIVADVAATFATVLLFGWLLLFSGIVALVHAFRVGTWSGFFMSLLSALLRGFTGYLLIRYPVSGAVALTLILATFFIVGGAFRAIGPAMMNFPRWGWSTFSGIVSIVLGIVLLAQLPLSSIWFIGFAIGLDLILDGGSVVAFATAIRSLPPLPTYTTKAA